MRKRKANTTLDSIDDDNAKESVVLRTIVVVAAGAAGALLSMGVAVDC